MSVLKKKPYYRITRFKLMSDNTFLKAVVRNRLVVIKLLSCRPFRKEKCNKTFDFMSLKKQV